jgi:CYTH domain-containing protein
MKRIELFEKALENTDLDLRELGINRLVLRAYANQKATQNEYLDFDESIWQKDIDEILSFLRENKMENFTISLTSSSLLYNIDEFEKRGCKLVGLTHIKSPIETWMGSGERETIPALLLKV